MPAGLMSLSPRAAAVSAARQWCSCAELVHEEPCQRLGTEPELRF